jgi:hypothetical protein
LNEIRNSSRSRHSKKAGEHRWQGKLCKIFMENVLMREVLLRCNLPKNVLTRSNACAIMTVPHASTCR